MEFFEDLQQYFRGEKSESAVILWVSVAFLAASLVLAFWVRQPFTKGLGTVLLLSALIGGTVGATVFFRTDGQVAELSSLYGSNPQEFAEVEGRRIDKVVASFRYYRIMYVVAGIAALAFVSLTRLPALHGAAVGLFIFAAMGFTIDHYAEERAEWYAARVHGQASPD
jgi:hypothetical protein